MKDEEMAEEWVKDHSGLIGSYKYVKYDYDSMQQAFLAGLKAGRDIKIKELETENAELKNKLTEKVTLESLDDICSKGFYKKLLVQQLEKEKTEIEKKIAELEKEDRGEK